jgi:hypothetical protein
MYVRMKRKNFKTVITELLREGKEDVQEKRGWKEYKQP